MTDPTSASVDPHSRTGRAFESRAGAKPASLPRRSSLDEISASGTMTGAQRFLRACLRQPVDVTPVWFLRQAGRYMPEYQAVRRHRSLLDICRTPQLASEVT